jgi:Lar family restriction alleviation protein
MKAEIELKPCPFCGEANTDDLVVISEWRTIPGPKGSINDHNFNVACSCGAMGPDADTPEKAVERWNNRAGEA